MTKSRTILWVLPLAALVAAGYFGWQRSHAEDVATGAGKKSASLAQAPAIPVTIAPVVKTDFPVYLSGLGTVQGFNTVLVRTRVDGQIDKIAFTEGQQVKQGDVLVQIDPRPYQATLDQAKAKKAQDQASLANANLDLQRFTNLGEFATRQQTDTQRSTVAQLTAQIAADDAAITNAQTQVDYTTVKAPIPGVAGLRQVDVGNIVNAATQTGIVTIAQIEPIAVIFTAPEDQLPYINEAQSAAPLKMIALTTDGKKPLSEGVLSVINNQVDTTSGTIRLKAVFDNKNHALWPGQSVSTRLLVTTLKDATVIPDDAVQHGVDGLYAFAVSADNKAELRKISVSTSIDGRSVVDKGLSPGERVIVAGQYKVLPGSPVAMAAASSDAGVRQGGSAMKRKHFIAVHPLSDRNLIADGGHPVRRPRRLSPAAGGAAAAGRFPDHPGLCLLAGRQPRNHGLVGGTAAGAATGANPRRRADDVDQFARHVGGHDPIRPQPQHRRRRERRAGRDQCRRRPVAEEPPLAADLSQGQSGRFTDPAVVGDLGHAAAHHRQRRRRRPAGAADQPDFRRRPGHDRRPAEAGDARPDRSRQAGGEGPVARRRPRPDRDHHRRQPEGQHRRRDPQLHHLRQRPVAGLEGLERRHHRLSQRRPVADPRHRPGGHRARRRQAGGLGQRQARRVPRRVQAARRQRHRDRRQDQGAVAAAGGRDPAGHQDRHSSPTAPRPFAPRSRTSSSRCC